MDQPESSNPSKVRAPYEAPAIIYEGLITTRAGTELPPNIPTEFITDPVDIFDD
jgi:hypothetical protein